MKVKKLDEAGKETIFNQERSLKKANSLSDAYGLLRQELIANKADEKAISQFDSAVKDIESITNTLDINVLKNLSIKLEKCQAGMSASSFIKLFGPTQEDLARTLKPAKLNFSGDNSLTKLGLSNDFLAKLVAYKGGGKASTTAIGEYEFLMAVAYKDGKMGSNGASAGDVNVQGKNIEVKKIKSPAAIGYDIGYTAESIKAFDDFVAETLDGDRTTKTRPTRNAKSFDAKFKKAELPAKLQSIVGKSGNITYSDLFIAVFRDAINHYATRFDYLALCVGDHILMVEANNNLADFLLQNCKVVFADYVGKRVFKISR